MKSFDEAKDLFIAMNPNMPNKKFRNEIYEKYNAFQHTFIPAQMARTFGKDITIEMGIQKEIFNWNTEISKNSSKISFLQDTYKDLHNNDVGAFYGEKIAEAAVEPFFEPDGKLKNDDIDLSNILMTIWRNWKHAKRNCSEI